MKESYTTLTLDKDDFVLVIRRTPALICENCGEEYVDSEVSSRVLEIANEAARSGVQFDVRTYPVA